MYKCRQRAGVQLVHWSAPAPVCSTLRADHCNADVTSPCTCRTLVCSALEVAHVRTGISCHRRFSTGCAAQHPGVEWQPCHAAAVLGHQGCSRQVSQMRCLCCCWQALHAFLPAYCRHVQPLSEHRMPCTACLLLVPTGCTWPKLLEIFSRQAAWWHGGVC